ncbi:TM2 domain-containing protein [Mycobacterium sp. DSM 3803]|nr:TM2 domain-containing protein [Mycobacterium sp. DSM 3803]
METLVTQGSSYGSQSYPQQSPPYGQQPDAVQKSKVVAGILGILLGSIGIHNFYLGKTGRGIVQIIVTVVTFGIGGIWGFIEGILILVSKPGTSWHRDAAGVELAD